MLALLLFSCQWMGAHVFFAVHDLWQLANASSDEHMSAHLMVGPLTHTHTLAHMPIESRMGFSDEFFPLRNLCQLKMHSLACVSIDKFRVVVAGQWTNVWMPKPHTDTHVRTYFTRNRSKCQIFKWSKYRNWDDHFLLTSSDAMHPHLTGFRIMHCRALNSRFHCDWSAAAGQAYEWHFIISFAFFTATVNHSNYSYFICLPSSTDPKRKWFHFFF